MTRKLGSILIAFATVCIVLADASDAQARRRLFGGGSWGSNGGSWGDNGSHGSWGGNGGSWGSNGSWGGRWRRHGSNGGRWNCGSHGGNGSYGGNGSHGGAYHNGCGSHGGTYHNGSSSEGGSAYYGEGNVYSAERQNEVRYYGNRNGTIAAPAPIYRDGEVSAEHRDMQRQQGDVSSQSDVRQGEMQRNGADQGSDPNQSPPAPPSPGQQDQGPGVPPPQGPQDQNSAGTSSQPNNGNTSGAESGAGT